MRYFQIVGEQQSDGEIHGSVQLLQNDCTKKITFRMEKSGKIHFRLETARSLSDNQFHSARRLIRSLWADEIRSTRRPPEGTHA